MTYKKSTIQYLKPDVPPDSVAAIVLDQSLPTESATEHRYTIWDVFKTRSLAKWKSNGALFFTLTINSKLKYKNKYLIRCIPDKQAKYFKFLIQQTLVQYAQDIQNEVHYYIFFEYTKAGVIHAHGIIYCQSDEVIISYPYYINAFYKTAQKNGFNKLGTKCESIKSHSDVCKYISKDIGKHPIIPVWA